MNRRVLTLWLAGLVCVAGCGIVSRDEQPPPAPVVPVEAAARDSFRDYGNALAVEHRATAANLRSGRYRSWLEAKNDHIARTKAARETSFRKLSEAMNESIGGEFNPAKGAEEYDAAARGFAQ